MYTRSMLATLPEPTESPSATAAKNEQMEESIRTVASMATSLATRDKARGLGHRPIIIWDTETTGLSPDKHHIVEIALEELGPPNGQSSMLSFSSLVHPVGVKMPRAAERVHGITNAMMRDSPTFKQVWPDLAEYVEDVAARNGGRRPIFVAHNMAFDLRFLREELRRIEQPLPQWDFACSLRDVAHVLWPKKPAKLSDLVTRFGIVNEEAHRALCDVRATADVLHAADTWLAQKYQANQHDRAPVHNLEEGDRIRSILGDAALKRREGIHGPDITKQMKTADDAHAGVLSSDDEEASFAEEFENLDLNSTVEEDDEDLEEMSNISDDELEPEDEENVLRYHWVPDSKCYHNRRDCVRLEQSLCIESSERAPAGRMLCHICRMNSYEETDNEETTTNSVSIPTRSISNTQSARTPPRRNSKSRTSSGSPTSIMSALTQEDKDATMEGGFVQSKRRRQPFYIAPTGRLYHTSRACNNLELAKTIMRIDSWTELLAVPGKRYRCSLCCK